MQLALAFRAVRILTERDDLCAAGDPLQACSGEYLCDFQASAELEIGFLQNGGDIDALGGHLGKQTLKSVHMAALPLGFSLLSLPPEHASFL